MCRARALYGIICKERASGLSPYIIQPQESSKHTAGRAGGARRRKAAPEEVNKANININARGAQHKAGVHECSAEQTFVYDLLRCPPPLHLLALTLSLSLTVYSIAGGREPLAAHSTCFCVSCLTATWCALSADHANLFGFRFLFWLFVPRVSWRNLILQAESTRHCRMIN
jgi:hypothetical protein